MDREQLAVILNQHLKSWARAGVTHLPLAAGVYGDLFAEMPASSGVSLVREVAGQTNRGGDVSLAGDVSPGLSFRESPTTANDSSSSPTPSKESPLAEGAEGTLVTPSFIPGFQSKTIPPKSVSLDTRPYGSPLDLVTRQNQLASLATEVAACQRCEILTKCRKQTVFGVGNPQARLCFFGEAPGQEEDQQGEPFVGAAGQLLNRIMEACRLSRQDVYILNTIKCRPPENRNPTEIEQQNCWEYAEQQLEIIQPEFICCLGRIAAQALLKTTIPVGRLRGTFHQYRSSQVVVTYHPSYLLRTPSAKKQTWDDMKMLMAKMGVEL